MKTNNNKIKYKMTSFMIEEGYLKWLHAISKKKNISIAELIRRAIGDIYMKYEKLG